MLEDKSSRERARLLTEVAEMYYLLDMNQAEIAEKIGVTRSMISRMLSEARQKGIVDIRIHRLQLSDPKLEAELVKEFNLLSASVIEIQNPEPSILLKSLGRFGADVLSGYLESKMVIGIPWGTTVSAVVSEIEVDTPYPVKIVQLVGAMDGRHKEYDGPKLVSKLAKKLNGEGYYINAPFICPNRETVEALINTPGIRETIEMGRLADIAVLGVGSTSPEFSSFYLAGYVSEEDLKRFRIEGAVGDVCGLHFDILGNEVCGDFCERLVTIRREDLNRIPLRLGIAGGPGKVTPLLGALRGGYINVLITDNNTACMLLEASKKPVDRGSRLSSMDNIRDTESVPSPFRVAKM
jgi:deoxyribonucleoside regulator